MIWIIVLLLIFIVPFPLLLKIIYDNNKIYIFIYNLRIYPSKKVIESMPEPKPDGLFPKFIYINTIKSLYDRCKDSLSKSITTLDVNITYGFEDSAVTGIFYGILHSIIANIYNLLNSTFNVKHFNSNIQPMFNRSIFKIKVKSIVFINLGKIIYISILIFSAFKKAAKYHLKPKEVS